MNDWMAEERLRSIELAQRANDLVKHYRYKPTVELSVHAGASFNGCAAPVLRIEMKVPNSRSALEPVHYSADFSSRGDVFGYDYYDRRDLRKSELNPDGREVSTVAGSWSIPEEVLEVGAEDDFERWLFHILTELEMHEAREWFRKDGKIVDDPHNPTGRLS